MREQARDASDGPEPGSGEAQASAAIARDPRFERLVRRRSRFAWTLTAIMLAIYFGYILLVAFRPDLLALPIGDGVTSLGIPVGLGVIVAGVVLTAIYVRRANGEFDREFDALRREHGG